MRFADVSPETQPTRTAGQSIRLQSARDTGLGMLDRPRAPAPMDRNITHAPTEDLVLN